MAYYTVKIANNGKVKYISLPALLCRTANLKLGDTLLLEPQVDGSIVIVPSNLLPSVLQQLRTQQKPYGTTTPEHYTQATS